MKNKKNNIDEPIEIFIETDISKEIGKKDYNSVNDPKRSNYISVMDTHRPPKEKPSKD